MAQTSRRGALRRRRGRGRVGRRGARGPAVGGPGAGRCCCSRPVPITARPRPHPPSRARTSSPRWASRAASGPSSWPRGPRASRASLYIRGRGAGGSSSVNALCAIRGTRRRLRAVGERIRLRRGGAGTRCSPRSFGSRTTSTTAATASTAAVVRIPLARPAPGSLSPFDDALCAAWSGLGYPTADDYHAPGATGVSRVALTLRDGRRVSTNDAYLEPARGRPNLHVRGDVLVDRVHPRRSARGRCADGGRRDDRRRAP